MDTVHRERLPHSHYLVAVVEVCMVEQNNSLREWNTLDIEEQTTLRIEYGHCLDSLPPTCSLETKIERFRNWLRDEKASYIMNDPLTAHFKRIRPTLNRSPGHINLVISIRQYYANRTSHY